MKAKYITSGVFLCVIISFMFLSVYSLVSKKVDEAQGKIPLEIKIDWESLYPFESEENTGKNAANTIFGFIKAKFDFIKAKLEDYSSSSLLGYYGIVETAKLYEDTVKWNMVNVSEYNAVVKLDDGYLATFVESRDVTMNARATIKLSEFCRSNGIEFFYANFPDKICVYDDKNISGILDFSNQNADRFLKMIGDAGVKYYDFRKFLHDDNMKHRESFYISDLHWKAETGLWAARHILRILHDDYHWDTVPDVLNPDRFDYVVYPEWFLGTQGRKVTLERTRPDDFTLIYPKFNTSVQYKVPSREINTSGDMRVMYDTKRIETKDYYNEVAYRFYNYGDSAITESENNLIRNGKKILIIHDSFSDVTLPFIAIGTQNVYSLDLRYFTGSVISFIKQTKPDAVAVMYYSAILGRESARSPEKQFFDFR